MVCRRLGESEEEWLRSIEKKIKKQTSSTTSKKRKWLPKSIFFSKYGSKGPIIFIASVGKNHLASGFRTNVTEKVIGCVASYMAEMQKRTGKKNFGIKTPVGTLVLLTEDREKA